MPATFPTESIETIRRPTPDATPSSTPHPKVEFWVGQGVPEELRSKARSAAEDATDRIAWQNEPAAGGTGPSVGLIQVDDAPSFEWIYAVVAPFATIADGTSLEDVLAGWRDGQSTLGELILEPETASVFTQKWGSPSGTLAIVPGEELVDHLWSRRPSWSIVPFHKLEPALKVMTINGMSPIRPSLPAADYPLRSGYALRGEPAAVAEVEAILGGLEGNRREDRMTRIVMTGVTALGRATAFQMEIQGVTAPAAEIGPILSAADITHISHEVPFAPECPYPNPIGDPVFCARDGYLDLLKAVGADVVELTGNHVNDWGTENLLHTIDVYESAGMQTFGGGRDLSEAWQPALLEHNGNRIAFIGCNPVGPAQAWAGEGRPGSLPCDYPAFQAEISRLHDEGHLVVATLQYSEYYQYAPGAGQREDFRALIDAGAAAVSGSQGHHAQGFDLYKGAFIHYGLGNLFFDQMDMLGTRQSFADFYTVYEGRLLAVELYTSLIESYCCPRIMSESERIAALTSVFQASGW